MLKLIAKFLVPMKNSISMTYLVYGFSYERFVELLEQGKYMLTFVPDNIRW